MTDTRREKKPSLLKLVSDVPQLVRELVMGEIELLKSEMITKIKALGIGAGLIAAAAVILLFMVGVLLTAAILALALVMPGWLAALLVALLLLIVAAIIGLIGYRHLKKGIPPVPTDTIASLQKDLDTIKGVGKRETP
ncbi:phage holin family protein [Galbitalea soli]|uniref:Phage holin family protein n=1 Tax=Galbitalea soli TaxID=1268042 RepID=A0A7C9PPQ9_9MICO|nr:phage holin family protein [Galbitalea soli]NEM92450.1 phage holin family protein [Galbitalea soli]NYJ29485.1 hypothetical protein [Galbitalea soli]